MDCVHVWKLQGSETNARENRTLDRLARLVTSTKTFLYAYRNRNRIANIHLRLLPRHDFFIGPRINIPMYRL